MLSCNDLFNLSNASDAGIFDGLSFPWEALPGIKEYVLSRLDRTGVTKIRQDGEVLRKTCVLYQGEVLTDHLHFEPGDVTKGRFKVYYRDDLLVGASVVYAGACLFDNDITLGTGVVVEPGALIKGPTMIGDFSEVRQGAYIRGNCLVGRSCVVGHVTEIKNAVMLDQAKAGHFAYIGDSILGRDTNLGAGTKLANLKFIPGPTRIQVGGEVHLVNLHKFGAILGDHVQTGCNSVTNPGTVLGRRSLVGPNETVASGYYPPHSIILTG
ncbi:MAG: glucose-1-phosphate thymidylyltransferase [Deltaproteobacteria bacterium]|nr:glucose-1-phosphate thymidylyltransferase [Deltaproteobacteria bacterium]